MNTVDKVRANLYEEITRDRRNVRLEYLKHFDTIASEFATAMGQAVETWAELSDASPDDKRRMRVLALAYTAIALHVNSMKLLLSGNTIAAGNIFRQVVETIALTFLCSGKGMTYLDRFEADKYSTSDSLRDVRRNAKNLGLNAAALIALERVQKFHSKYSHPSKLTIGIYQSFAGEGIYVGSSFDPGKLAVYEKETAQRLKLAKLYPNFLQVIQRNISAW
jgi:hypothetical protein